jgi:hypothetical protein
MESGSSCWTVTGSLLAGGDGNHQGRTGPAAANGCPTYNPDIELFQGENGCPSILEWTHALAHYPWTEYSQAKWFLRRLVDDGVRGIRSSAYAGLVGYGEAKASVGSIGAQRALVAVDQLELCPQMACTCHYKSLRCQSATT